MQLSPERKKILEESAKEMLAKVQVKKAEKLKSHIDLALENIPEDPRETRIMFN
jgi:hypothetical protein